MAVEPSFKWAEGQGEIRYFQPRGYTPFWALPGSWYSGVYLAHFLETLIGVCFNKRVSWMQYAEGVHSKIGPLPEVEVMKRIHPGAIRDSTSM